MPNQSAPSTPKPSSPAALKATKKKAGANSRGSVDAARRALSTLTGIIEQAGDRDAEQILGEGRLEGLLKAVLPARKRSAKTTYDYLASQKRRASLMAQLRHSINTTYSFATDVHQDCFLSPTRVQWFYDGLTFIEGAEPFSGVIGLYRDGKRSYGLAVSDAAQNASLGPSEADFVSIEAARRSFAAASQAASESAAEFAALCQDSGVSAEPWLATLQRHPWVFGGQHVKLVILKRDDPSMPNVFAERIDGAHDVLLLGSPGSLIFGKGGRLQRSFQDTLHQAEQTLCFVLRQADYLGREFGLKLVRPRAFVISGRALSSQDRETLRHHVETRHAELRVFTYDDLVELAAKTRAFFEARF